MRAAPNAHALALSIPVFAPHSGQNLVGNGKVRPVQVVVRPALMYNLVFQNTFAGPMKPVVDESKRRDDDDRRSLKSGMAERGIGIWACRR